MAKTKQIFVADDGTEFETEMEANAYELSLSMAAKIDEYIESTGVGKGPAGLLRKHLPAFTAFLQAEEAKD